MQASDHILLTGAGFTHNFGTPLARDVWNLVFNHPEVQGNSKVRELLLENQDFEDAYNVVFSHGRFAPTDQQALLGAVREAFDQIDDTLREWTEDGPYPVHLHGVQKLISRFAGSPSRPGLYFTLNQDLFLERWYFNGERPAIVGIQHHPDWFSGTFCQQRLGGSHHRILSSEAPEISGVLEGNRFLYIKLHGSSNWFSSDGQQRMVIGRDKPGQIAREPLLTAYWQFFEQALSSARRRLLIIGYGFCDKHVNRALAEAIHGDHIELFILSPKPAQDLRAEVRSKPHGEQIWEGLRGHFPGTLLDVFPNDQSQTPLWREIDARFF